MKIATLASFVAVLMLASPVVGQTAHAPGTAAPQPGADAKAEMMKGCQDHHADAIARLEQLASTLDEARGSGDVTSIHAAVERSQSNLAAVRAAIGKCSAKMSAKHGAGAAPASPAPPAEHKH
jgi:hypothetical protein